ncbi:UNVERIFIED_CONTAM: hypothetical protein PYX00_004664 [Menopon gallinae]|uniref:D-3-phosphoglycerate dehydrogenase n=1 Tax=Menopon gallinae TaxID=328185 RepID=A0AAW2I6K7_9NEOP
MAVELKSVLVSDAVDPLCVDLLKSHGIEVVCKFKLSKDQLIQELQQHDGLIVRSDTKVTKEVIDNAPRLRVVGRAGTGVDNIDLDAATKNGVIVINTPGGNSISACEMTCALITSLARNVSQACHSLKSGRWDRKLYTGNELYGKTLAVLGLGRIGREVAKRMQSYGMRTIGFDPMVNAEDAKAFGVEKMELDEIWPLADYITVHTPLIPQTKNLIGDKALSKCKKGVCVVNVARGGIVDEEALLRALEDGRCGGAALDVFLEEPPKSEVTLSLIKNPLVVATPHLGASTYEAQQRVAVEIAEQFVALSMKNKPGENFIVNGAVNAPVLAATMVASNGPWITLVERLGRILEGVAKTSTATDLQLTVSGKGLENMKFLNVPLIAGFLHNKMKGKINLINAPAYGKEAGVNVQFKHEEGEPSIKITLGSHSVSGTLGAGNVPVLLTVNECKFLPSGVAVGKIIGLFEGLAGQCDLGQILTEIKKQGGDVHSMAAANGSSKVYIVIQTVNDGIQTINLNGLTIC